MKQLVLWKPVLCKSVNYTDVLADIIGEMDVRHRGTLLYQIMKMPSKKPISLNDATRLLEQAVDKAFDLKKIHSQPGGSNWYYNNFISWISELGYHIDITGDEFEPYVISSQIS